MPDSTDSAPRDGHWVRGIRYPDGNRVYKIRRKKLFHTRTKTTTGSGTVAFQNHLLAVSLEHFRPPT